MRKLNEKKHLLLSRKEDAQLEDHIAGFINEYKSMLYARFNIYVPNNKFNINLLTDDENDYFIKLKNIIPSYLNTYEWLENDYEIHLYQNDNISDVIGNCVFDHKNIFNNKLTNLIIRIEINLNDFNVNELAAVFHHEFHHVYEVINKVKNNSYKKYKYYHEYMNNCGDRNLNKIAESLYLVSPDERHARLENFYYEIKNENLKNTETFKNYNFNYNVIKWIEKYYNQIDIDLFLEYFGDFTEEICKIKKVKSETYFKKIIKYIKRWTDDTIKRMKDIDDYVNNSKSDEILESYISSDRYRKMCLHFDKEIAKRKNGFIFDEL